jgi:hypothetical protein
MEKRSQIIRSGLKGRSRGWILGGFATGGKQEIMPVILEKSSNLHVPMIIAPYACGRIRRKTAA